MKTCGNCHQQKPLTEFYPHSRDGYQSVCKHCKRDQGRIRNRQPKRREYNKAMFRKTYDRIKAEYYSRTDVRQRRALLMKMYRADPQLKPRHIARDLLNKAIKRGNVVKTSCACGNPKVDGHHTDYTKPLDVIWMCRSCHSKHHAKAEGK